MSEERIPEPDSDLFESDIEAWYEWARKKFDNDPSGPYGLIMGVVRRCYYTERENERLRKAPRLEIMASVRREVLEEAARVADYSKARTPKQIAEAIRALKDDCTSQPTD